MGFVTTILRPGAVAFATVFGLSGCLGPDPWTLHPDPETEHTVEAARALFADRTRITQDSFHGTQIEYHAPDGRAYLWYPGNSGVVPSLWKVSGYAFTAHEICWLYPTYSNNPVTGQSGGNWECNPSSTYNGSLSQLIEGDPFNLASGKVPFRLPKGKFTAQELLNQWGKDPSNLKIIYPR